MKTEKVERLHGLNHGLILEKVYRMIKYNQNCSLKPYSDMNTKKKSKK